MAQAEKLPTPSTSHLDFATIYEPAEDSFLFLDTLSSTTESAFLHSRFDVGTGSGVILAFASAHADRIFGPDRHVLTLGVDVNIDACRGAAETADLTSALRRGSVDVLVFNPPYVPTETVPGVIIRDDDGGDNVAGDEQEQRKNKEISRFERESWLLALSYAGGQDGMEVTERLLAQVPQVLSARGVAYVLFWGGGAVGVGD
ncbi:hypothetical protein DV735_g1718, partial [Chaetothyriales sp. CBS 134920]